MRLLAVALLLLAGCGRAATPPVAGGNQETCAQLERIDRELKSEKSPGAQATLRQALGRCGDASAIVAIEEIRKGQRTLDTDLYLVIREIRRRLEAPRA